MHRYLACLLAPLIFFYLYIYILFCSCTLCMCQHVAVKTLHLHFASYVNREKSFTKDASRIAVTRAISWWSIQVSITIIKLGLIMFFFGIGRLILSNPLPLCVSFSLLLFRFRLLLLLFCVCVIYITRRPLYQFLRDFFSAGLHKKRITHSSRASISQDIYLRTFPGAVKISNGLSYEDGPETPG